MPMDTVCVRGALLLRVYEQHTTVVEHWGGDLLVFNVQYAVAGTFFCLD